MCHSYIGPISTQTSGLEEDPLHRKLTIFPNPVTNVLNFSTYLDEFVITNSLGQEVCKGKGNSVPTSGFKPGIYFLQAGEKMLKFIVAH